MQIHNPFATDGVWLKANLHTHTTNSDGDTDPADRVAQYAEAGYDVLAITDHRCVTAIESLDEEGLTLLRSLEAHPDCPGAPAYHLVFLNVDRDFSYDEGLPANEVIAEVREHGGEVIVGHPYWCGHTIRQVLALEGIIGLEVYNATCAKKGKADSSMFWDYLLSAGRMLPAVSVDDVHRGPDIFQGWTMIRAASSEPEDVMEALRRGSYYATCGPELHDVRWEDDAIAVSCSPVSAIHFMCPGPLGTSVYAEQPDGLRNASFSPPDAADYVRIQVEDARGRRAWSNPFPQ
jgi:hypothetical protein